MPARQRNGEPHRPYVDLLDQVAVIGAVDPLGYRRIRLHIAAVREWFAERVGWPVIMTREFVRLVKQPALTAPGQGLRWAQQPLDYELLTWVLWYGEQAGADQFVLTDLVQELAAQAAASIGPGHLDWNLYPQRQGLRRALGALEDMGALRRLDGSTEEWAGTGQGNTLYEFTGLAQHLSVFLPAELFVDLAIAGDGHRLYQLAPGAGTAEQRLYRSLLLSPVLYAADDPDAFALLRGRDRRRAIARDLQETLGWDLEVTANYACLLRPVGAEGMPQAVFPFRGVLCHVALLLMGALRERVMAGDLLPDAGDRLPLSAARLEMELVDLHRRWGANWGSTLGRLPVAQIVRELVPVLREWSLLDGPDADGQFWVLPLAARLRGFYRDDGQGLEGDEA